MGASTVVGSLLIAFIAGGFAFASQRSASRAAKLNTQATIINTDTTARVAMEKDAYQRARLFDIQTIERQERDLVRLRARVEELERREEELENEVERLKHNLPK